MAPKTLSREQAVEGKLAVWQKNAIDNRSGADEWEWNTGKMGCKHFCFIDDVYRIIGGDSRK